MQQTTIEAIRTHAAEEHPRECCGLVIVERGREIYVRCSNAARTPSEHFVLPADEYAAAETRGEVLRIVHSHPDATTRPSQADRVSCEASGLPWTIVACPGGEIDTFEPSGYEAPLVGRQFSHGVLDCWTLVRDYYARELGILLEDADRADRWWDDGISDLYTEGYAARGGILVPEGEPMRVSDVILMQIRSKNGVPNHAGVYIGDNLMLHHMYGRLSSRDVYGGYWRENTRMVLRYDKTRLPQSPDNKPALERVFLRPEK
jgi:proteasome lid subunit RPN8/RPN11